MSIAAQWAVSVPGSNPHVARSFHSTGGPHPERPAIRATSPSRAAELLAHLPLRFEANRDQTEGEVKYFARGPNYAIFLKPAEAVIALQPAVNESMQQAISGGRRAPSSVIRMKLVGGDRSAKVSALKQTNEKRNYFIGGDPKKWRTNLPSYATVLYSNVYPGIDALFYGNGKQLEYDLIVAPHADPNRVRLSFEGAKVLRVDASGALVATTEAGELTQPKPVAYQEHNGARREIRASYELGESQQVRIKLGEYDANKRVVIDPVLVYSTAFGGSNDEHASAIAVDPAGSVYVTGSTPSIDFPTVNPLQPPDQNRFTQDAFVAKLNPAGDALIYATYLGGGFSDLANGIAVDSAGNAYVTGGTNSRDFPTTAGAFQSSAPGGDSPTGGDAFVTKLNSAGSALIYSTYLGGGPDQVLAGFDAATGIAVDSTGSAYVTGSTLSPNFPAKRALFPQLNRGFPTFLLDGFLTKLNPSGSSLVYSSYLGGSGQDRARAVAVDSRGNAYVTGETYSSDFLPPGLPFGIVESNVFLLKVSASGRSIVYGKVLDTARTDAGTSVAADASGNAYVTGETQSADMVVTAGALQTKLAGSVAFKTSDAAVNWSAIDSGLLNQTVDAIAVDPANPAIVFAARSFAVSKSTDAGASWTTVLNLNGGRYIAIDPKNSATVYSFQSKSTNGGLTWTNILLPQTTGLLNVLAIDPKNTSILYAGTGGMFGDTFSHGGVFKSTDSGGTWRNVTPPAFNSFVSVRILFLDPKTPSILYAGDQSLVKSTDGGETWSATGLETGPVSAAAIDPTNPLTIFAGVNLRTDAQLVKSTDGGATWNPAGLSGISINTIAISPADSSTVYAGVGDQGEGGAVFKSTDGGETWAVTSLSSMTVQTLSIARLDPSTVYAGAFEDIDAFVMKFDPAGSLVYSTYLGGAGSDRGAGIGVDAAGNAYVAGRTFSDRFPVKDAVKPEKFNNPSASSIFVTKLALRTNPTTSPLVYSTYLGGDEPGGAAGIAVDGGGKAYVTGTTGFRTTLVFPTLDVTHASEEVFVAKLVTPATITGASVRGKKLFVVGEGFDIGAVILLNGEPQKTRNAEDDPNLRLIGVKAGKKISLGVPVTLQVRNSDGMVSASFSFTRN
ncbi:MAG: SBBP repeat-containing protein [Blastocatellia bacterium]